MATAQSLTRSSCWRSSTKKSLFGQSRTRSIARIRFTHTIPINAYSAGAVLRLARMSRSTKRFPSTGKILMPACCGRAVQRSENQAASPAATVTVCPCNAFMEKSMLGHAGFLTSLKKSALSGMIEIVKGIEPETGYGSILQSEAEHAMREHRIRKTKTVCTYCGVGCSFDVWTKDRHILKIAPEHGPANGISTFVKGKFGWGRINSDDRLTTPLIREADKSRAASWDEALDLVAQKLSGLKRTNGPDSIAFISSFKCTNEESDLMQKLARAVIGTNHVDNCSRYCQSPCNPGVIPYRGLGRRLEFDRRYRKSRSGPHHRQQLGGKSSGHRDPGQELP